MQTFTTTTPLFEVMRDPSAHGIISAEIPELANNPILHTLYHYPLGLILGTEERLQGDVARREEILARITALTPAPGAHANSKPTRSRARSDYEPEDTTEASAKVTFPSSGAKWAAFEIELIGPRHGNPFTDVELSAEFCSSGTSLTVPGFYDGDATYRIRFLVPESGTWSFTTASNARSLNGISGAFDAGAAASRGVVRVAEQFHFAYDDGAPYVPIGTTSYVWTHQGNALEEQTLKSLAAGPFNKMRMCVFPKSYLFNENEPEIYPYEGSVEAGFDYLRPNPAFWRHLERRIDQLEELGIEADLILFHAYDRWGFSAMGPDADDLFVQYAVARLASRRNIWWSLANEYDLMFDKTTDDWERFAGIVTKNDPNQHLLSIHNCRDFYDHSRPWVTHCSIQRRDIYKTAEMTTEWREQYGKPIVIDECAYEGNIDQGWGNITGEEMTRRFWEGAVRGGYVGHGETYMDPDDILWWAKGGELKGTSPERIGFLRRILDEAPGGRLEPLEGSWDVPSAGIENEYELIYFGFNQPTYRRFVKPQDLTYEIDIIDTWNMTVDTLPGTFSGRFRIELPGRQYVAVRLRAVA
ncbi:DUF5605 domain-containing protein [Arthrobacter sp. B2a2-09]|uniref:DUF5605 domain-containing protein n=1 Tax=Arthrobacter sp. B2a2-09 TaxID=2952822 RepID=UPI0022CD74AD|nr:DUF5605 domain-containing protein [Arthrobacter sp. B2a2-09]MCZ9881191.1 DUF5605 domain-containing protein [Arthrobacter sp. B2a2-09]